MNNKYNSFFIAVIFNLIIITGGGAYSFFSGSTEVDNEFSIYIDNDPAEEATVTFLQATSEDYAGSLTVLSCSTSTIYSDDVYTVTSDNDISVSTPSDYYNSDDYDEELSVQPDNEDLTIYGSDENAEESLQYIYAATLTDYTG